MERLAAEEVLVVTPTREGLPSRAHSMNGGQIGSEDKETYECLQCFIIFSTEQHMLRHNKKFHKDVYLQHLQKNNTVFLCYKCNKRFQSPAKLRQHSLSHGTDDRPFPCEVCREAYATFTELTTHRREVCPKRKFHCKVCGMNFQNLDSLEAHKSIHLARRRGRPSRTRAAARRTPDGETMLTDEEEDEEEEEEDDEEEEEEEEEKEDEELNGRAEDQRVDQMLWITDKGDTVADGEVKVEGGAEDQMGSRAQTSSPQERASEGPEPSYNAPCAENKIDLTFESMEVLTVHKQEAPWPQPDAPSATPEMMTVVPKEEEEQEDIDSRAEDQRSRLPTKRVLTADEGCPSKRMASEQWTPVKTVVPKKEEEEEEEEDEELNSRAEDQGASMDQTLWITVKEDTVADGEVKVEGGAEDQMGSRAQTSSPQERASESAEPRYNAPCAEDNCDLTFESMEVLTVHKQEAPWPQPDAPSATPEMMTVVPKEEEEQEDIDSRAEDQRSRLPTKQVLTADEGCPSKRTASEQWTPVKTVVPKKKKKEEEEEVHDRSIAQRTLRTRTSMVQRPRYNIPCPVDNCELTFPSVEDLRVHKKEAHRPKPTAELAPP